MGREVYSRGSTQIERKIFPLETFNGGQPSIPTKISE